MWHGCDCFFFFFSSRRRHTRSLCDWSSDVCSSDLDRLARHRVVAEFAQRGGGRGSAAGLGLLVDLQRLAEGDREDLRLGADRAGRSEEHTSELQSHSDLVCRLLLEKKKKHT